METLETRQIAFNTDFQKEAKLHDGDCRCEKMESDFVKLVDRISDQQEQTKRQSQTTAKTSVVNQPSQHNDSRNVKELKQKLEATEKKIKS